MSNREFRSGRSQTKFPSERSQAKVPKRKVLNERSQVKHPKRNLSSERSQAKVPKRKSQHERLSSECFKANELRLKFPRELSARKFHFAKEICVAPRLGCIFVIVFGFVVFVGKVPQRHSEKPLLCDHLKSCCFAQEKMDRFDGLRVFIPGFPAL